MRILREPSMALLPVEGYPNGSEPLREWFRRNHGREASERELGELQDALARRDATPPLNYRLPGEPGFE